MTAIVTCGGKQYRVSNGVKILVDRIDKNPGEEVHLKDVLAVTRGDKTEFGSPLVEGADVVAVVKKHLRGTKITVFKKRPKKGYKRTIGHRQSLTELQIEKIILGEKNG
ncbi:MAG: 50S ribosomal protein L21 [Elusimicrobia bacterium]|nr:50S ribosomal protein L21 [Elusimicrobiota bacterium]